MSLILVIHLSGTRKTLNTYLHVLLNLMLPHVKINQIYVYNIYNIITQKIILCIQKLFTYKYAKTQIRSKYFLTPNQLISQMIRIHNCPNVEGFKLILFFHLQFLSLGINCFSNRAITTKNVFFKNRQD